MFEVSCFVRLLSNLLEECDITECDFSELAKVEEMNNNGDSN
jgi:hypothetical protein